MEKNKNKQDARGEVDEEKKVDKPAADDSVSGSRGGSSAVESPGVDEKSLKEKDEKSSKQKVAKPFPNRLREYRIENMMSKAELARKAGLSVLTVARIEKGYGCRMDTKRKILKALGLKLADRRKVFEDD